MSEPVTPTRTYLIVFATLLLLTGLTIGLAYLNVGGWNTILALGIAAAKACLIALFFMHVRSSSGLTRLVMLGGLLWLGILMVGTMDDVLTRGWLPVPGK